MLLNSILSLSRTRAYCVSEEVLVWTTFWISLSRTRAYCVLLVAVDDDGAVLIALAHARVLCVNDVVYFYLLYLST